MQPHFYRPKRSCGKVMFSQASVILFTGGVSQQALGQTPRMQTPPPPDGHCSGRYASYWNSFLFANVFKISHFYTQLLAIQSETFCVTCSTAVIALILSFVFFWQKTKNHTKKAKILWLCFKISQPYKNDNSKRNFWTHSVKLLVNCGCVWM